MPVLPWKQVETSCSCQQAYYELQSARGTYVPTMKLDQNSFKQQDLRCMPMLPWLQHFHANKLNNLLSLPKAHVTNFEVCTPLSAKVKKVNF